MFDIKLTRLCFVFPAYAEFVSVLLQWYSDTVSFFEFKGFCKFDRFDYLQYDLQNRTYMFSIFRTRN